MWHTHHFSVGDFGQHFGQTVPPGFILYPVQLESTDRCTNTPWGYHGGRKHREAVIWVGEMEKEPQTAWENQKKCFTCKATSSLQALRLIATRLCAGGERDQGRLGETDFFSLQHFSHLVGIRSKPWEIQPDFYTLQTGTVFRCLFSPHQFKPQLWFEKQRTEYSYSLLLRRPVTFLEGFRVSRNYSPQHHLPGSL